MLKLTVPFGGAVYLTTGAGETVKVVVERDGHGRVSVGIDAPRTVKIEREALYAARTSAVGDDDAPAETR